jgi:hypothetical protein
VTLTHPGRAEGQQVEGTLKELATRQFAQLAIQRRWENIAIESLEDLAGRQLGPQAKGTDLRVPPCGLVDDLSYHQPTKGLINRLNEQISLNEGHLAIGKKVTN